MENKNSKNELNISSLNNSLHEMNKIDERFFFQQILGDLCKNGKINNVENPTMHLIYLYSVQSYLSRELQNTQNMLMSLQNNNHSTMLSLLRLFAPINNNINFCNNILTITKSSENFDLSKLLKSNFDNMNNNNNIIISSNLMDSDQAAKKILNKSNIKMNVESNNQSIKLKKFQTPKKKITRCPHTNRKHYAKNMCNNCYHAKGRAKKAWDCEHKDKSHYAFGICQSCYQMKYIDHHRKKKIYSDNNEIIIREYDGHFDNVNIQVENFSIIKNEEINSDISSRRNS